MVTGTDSMDARNPADTHVTADAGAYPPERTASETILPPDADSFPNDALPPAMASPGRDSLPLAVEIQGLSRVVRRYLGLTMPANARVATDGNANIIMYLDRHRDREVFQHDIESRFRITRSTASRVLARMERKGLIVRRPVARDARLKRIVLTEQADCIVADLAANGDRTEDILADGFTSEELTRLREYFGRLRHNIDVALDAIAREQIAKAQPVRAPVLDSAEYWEPPRTSGLRRERRVQAESGVQSEAISPDRAMMQAVTQVGTQAQTQTQTQTQAQVPRQAQDLRQTQVSRQAQDPRQAQAQTGAQAPAEEPPTQAKRSADTPSHTQNTEEGKERNQ
ncbi:MAG: MarR family winged helix-turn-helix transcriptional regulator [Bifidobacterium sp.]|uniref:MarR family winged helix-turn-helix transcriptional regulator n=1 Tax=Bifidobacterium sp. TaxID=41200 RepID=UPI003F016656